MRWRLLYAVAILSSYTGYLHAQIARSVFTDSVNGWTLQGVGNLVHQPTGGRPGGVLRFEDGSDININDMAYALAPAPYLGPWTPLEGVASLSWEQVILNPGEGPLPILAQAMISGPGGSAVWESSTYVDLTWQTFTVPIHASSWTMTSGTWSGLLANVTSLAIRIEGAFNSSGTVRDVTVIDNVVLAPAGTVIRVDANASGLRTGASWVDAFRYLEDAISVAKPTDEIWVANGTYTPVRAGGSRSASFVLRNQLGIYGGFAGADSVLHPGGETLRSQRDPASNICVLSGDLNGDDGPNFTNYADNSFQVVTATGLNNTCVLDGFVIRGGSALSADPASRGGGLYLESSAIQVNNCRFEANQATSGGAVTCWAGSHATFTRCSFFNNRASYGGAMYCDNSSPTLLWAVMIGNAATINGGGMYNDRSSPLLYNCLFNGNTATQAGGGLRNYNGSTPVFINCTLTQNVAGTESGGSANLLNSNFRFTNCILWANQVGTTVNQNTQLLSQNGNANPQINYCCIQGWTGSLGGTGNSAANPNFADIDGPDNIPGNADDNLRPTGVSECIDSGQNSAVPPVITVDLDGNPRFIEEYNVPNTGAGTPPLVDRGVYEAPMTQAIIVSTGTLTVSEGSTATFTVTLALPPASPVTVSTSRFSGDTDLIVADGATLVFDASNYTIPQTVTIAALEDLDYLNGSAVFVITSPGLPQRVVNATEADNDPVPTRLYVDISATGAQTGLNWNDAMTSLTAALDLARQTPQITEIWVANGTYRPAGPNGSRSASFELVSNVAVYGGFAGADSVLYPGGETDISQRDIAANPTVLSGDLNGNDTPSGGNIGENSFQVVRANNLTNVVVDGFTIADGNGSGNSLGGCGMVASNTPLTIRRCLFRNNRNVASGGGLLWSGSSLTMNACTFIGNRGFNGGGMQLTGTANLVNCAIIGNVATNRGGGVYVTGTSPVTLTNCLIHGCTASDLGGGVGLFSNAAATFNNCTLSYNTATNQPAGIYFSGTILTLANSILWGNTAGSATDESAAVTFAAGSRSISYCCYQGWSGVLGGTGNFNADPLFINHRGPDNILGTVDDDLRLSVRSPCIDAGNNSLVPSGITTDLGGLPRFIDDPSKTDTGAGTPPLVDIGCHESPPNQDVIVLTLPIIVPEGGTVQVSLRLALDPGGPVEVTPSMVGGDPDIFLVTTTPLAFDSSNWSIPQQITLQAAEDADWVNSTATLRLTLTGVSPHDVTATEADNEPLPSRIYVDQNATGLGTGVDWANAFTELRHALEAITARPGSPEIWVAKGTYRPAGPGGPRDASFALRDGLAIYGGFEGLLSSNYPGGETLLSQRNFAANPTILSGDLNGNDQPNGTGRSDNSLSVVTTNNNASTAILDGFTIVAGTGNGGGAVRSFNSSAQVVNCTMISNRSTTHGGAVHVSGGHLRIISCTFIGNSATSRGGAIHGGTPANLTVFNCRFYSNTCGYRGGAVSINQGTATVAGCIMSGNTATDGGGGIYGEATTLTVANCTLVGNYAGTSGGAILFWYNNFILANSILWNNSTSAGKDEQAQFSYGTNTLTLSHNCLEGWSGVRGGTGNFGTDPRFFDADGPDNIQGTIDDDLRPRVRSVCIDAGNNARVPAGLTVDVDGLPRFVDDPGKQDTGSGTPPVVDIGAHEAPPHQDFIVSLNPVNIPEGGQQSFTVRLAMAIPGPVTAALSLVDADPDISLVSSPSLVFTPSDWNIPQNVTVAAAEDSEWWNGTAQIRFVSAELPEVEPLDVPAHEIDNDPMPSRAYVDKTAAGTGDGTSWANAFNELRHALTAVRSRPGVPEVWVARGVYKPANSGGSRAASFMLQNGVAIYGGFAGLQSVQHPGGETLLSQRDWRTNPTVLSGDLAGNDDGTTATLSDNSLQVVTAVGLNNTPVLDGFTITGGYANDAIVRQGSGLFMNNASPTIASCRFLRNRTVAGGALLISGASTPVIRDCIFANNVSESAAGGAVRNTTSTTQTMTSCAFFGNSAASEGGAVLLTNVNMTMVNCLFSSNSATTRGGAVSVSTSARLTAINCTFGHNTAATEGAGVFTRGLSLTLRNSILWDNRTNEGTTQAAQLAVQTGVPNPSIAHCCIRSWSGLYGGVGNFGLDPQFILPDGLDGVPGTEDDNFRLLDNSPCIDAGNNSFLPPGVTTDLDGGPRIVLDFVDLGAYEYTSTGPVSVRRVNSRKVHGAAGAFDIDLLRPMPATARTVECRRFGPTQVIVDFSRDVFGVGGLDPSDVQLTSTGPVNGVINNLTISGRRLTIDMSGTSDVAQLRISFPGIRDSQDNPVNDVICFNVLAGDSDGNSSVNLFDLIGMRNVLSNTTTSSDFRYDVVADGVINILDMVTCRNNLNRIVPQTCD